MAASATIESVADTSFLIAFCRALETDRPDALFRDPFARTLAGDRGEALLRGMPGGVIGAAGGIVRTALLDTLIQRFLSRKSPDMVVNMGAGLDTRPYRLPLPPSLRWMEIDCPEILAYKVGKLADHRPRCQVDRFPADLSDGEAVARCLKHIGPKTHGTLVLTEGFLAYMTEEQVASIALAIQAHPHVKWWLTDLASPTAIQMEQKFAARCGQPNRVPFQFAPEAGPGFFRRFGWECAERYSCIDEARRLRRMPVPEAVLAALPQEQLDALRNMATLLVLERRGE